MRIVSEYSFNDGLKALRKDRPAEFSEVQEAINAAKPTGKLYSPKDISKAILEFLSKKGWTKPAVEFGAPGNLIEGDAVKNGVGLELQFGDYPWLGWDTLRKMTTLAEKGAYKFGIENAPMASLRRRMSKGVGSFEQVTERLEKTGNLDLSIPVAILGIDV